MLTGSNLAYSVNSSSLNVKSADYGEYIIVINFTPKSGLEPVIVKIENNPTILLHNQVHTYVFDPTDNSISAQSSPNF